MGKIKGWDKKTRYLWKEENSDRELIIDKSVDGVWDVFYDDGSPDGELLAGEHTYDEAYDSAIRWMRRHPPKTFSRRSARRTGWFNEPKRHSLARKGIKTRRKR